MFFNQSKQGFWVNYSVSNKDNLSLLLYKSTI